MFRHLPGSKKIRTCIYSDSGTDREKWISNDPDRYLAPLSGRGKRRRASKRRCGKCSLEEETVYRRTDLGQDTERGIDPGTLFPPEPEVEVEVKGNEG
jgi:hypothetical protein